MPEKIAAYLERIGEEIRWKRARPALLRELEDHALEQMDDCLAAGLTQEEAEQETLRQLGDPAEIGRQLDQLHRPRPQWGLLAMTLLLTLAGMGLQLALLWGHRDLDPGKLLMLAVLGMLALGVGYFANHMQLIRRSGAIYLGALALTALLLMAAPRTNHACYAAHYVTMLYPAVFALVLCRQREQGWIGLLTALAAPVPMAAAIALVPRQLDLLLLGLTAGILLLTAAWKDWFRVGRRNGLLAVGALGLVGSGLLWPLRDPVLFRLSMALHPEQDPMGWGYMATAIRSALEGARLWGPGELTGPWAGMEYWSVVPESGQDAFLVTVLHRLGWVPFLLLVGSLGALLLWVTVKLLRQRQDPSRLLALAVLIPFGVHTLLSLCLTLGYVCLGSFCPLLKMSGETVLELGLMGLLLSLLRQETLPYEEAAPAAPRPRGRWKLVYEEWEP